MSTIRVVEVTRGHIRVQVGDRSLTIQGEGHLPAPGSPGYLIYANSIRAWDPPHQSDALDLAQKKDILTGVLRHFDAKGTHYTVEGEPT
ncbi:Imm74 family immunity protein [Pendulispora albinea]|uniref:Immunity 74 family protein n=1 Tax=Pendulispora albinea TaxID=2741071 RepID=A0ABZ2LXC9_9BACT